MNIFIDDINEEFIRKNKELRKVNSALKIEFNMSLPIVEIPVEWRKWVLENGKKAGRFVTIHVKKYALLNTRPGQERVVADVYFDKNLINFINDLEK